MIIGVCYLGQLRQMAGRAEDRITVAAPCTVAEFVREVAGSNDRLRRVLLDEAGAIQPTILIFVEDEQAAPDRLLRDGDEVTLMTPIAGG